jgi:hypothetical protein
VITAQYYPSGGESVLVHAGGDDPLVMQETMSQFNCEEPKSVDDLPKGCAIGLEQSCLCSLPNDNVQIYKSDRFVGCSIVRAVPQPPSRKEVRDREIKDYVEFLRSDQRFWYVVEKLRNLGPGPERIKLIDKHWGEIYDGCYIGDRELLRIRARVLSDYIGLLDEDRLERERSLRPSHVVAGVGEAHQRRVSRILGGERHQRR